MAAMPVRARETCGRRYPKRAIQGEGPPARTGAERRRGSWFPA